MLILDQVAALDKFLFPLAPVLALVRDTIAPAVFPTGICEDVFDLPDIDDIHPQGIPGVYLQSPYFELYRQQQQQQLKPTQIPTEIANTLGSTMASPHSQQKRTFVYSDELALSDYPRAPWLTIMDQIHALPRAMRRALFSGIAAARACDELSLLVYHTYALYSG